MNSPQIGVIPGNHLVAVVKGAVVVVPHRERSRLNSGSLAAQTWSALSALIEDATARDGDRFGRLFCRNAAEWAADLGGDAEFGALAPVQDGYVLILHGGAAAIVEHGGGRDLFRGGPRCSTEVSEIRPAAYRAALYVTDDTLSTIDLPAERGVGSLIEGVVEGTGAVVWLEGTRPPAQVPSSGQYVELKPPKVFETFKRDDKPPPRRAPLPLKGSPHAAAAVPARPPISVASPQVRGIKCARGHFNDPRVAFCRLCGLRMNQTKEICEGERPPLGFLVLSDGTTLVLAADLIIGRDPRNSPSVRNGATPVCLSDTAGRLSRAHAEIRLIEWDVAVVDVASTNGTFVKPPGHDQWLRLTARRPYVLSAGTEVQIGGHTITFESPHAHL
ncbi:FHA domain-containing protein [Mycobacterium sp. B14F4]|uniref:FHA domain-containing protein n=1 Tax=Mycobacterium sp. B14F4 TaxID=3153565 RepID=UPI00325E7185